MVEDKSYVGIEFDLYNANTLSEKD